MDIMKMIGAKDLLDFSQNLSVARNYMGDRLFPDIKTENLQAEFYRLSDPLQIPTMALVHAFDTEAHIGTRPTIEKVAFEKLLIKEKINLSERVSLYLGTGAAQNSLVRYVYDDMGRLAESVKTRTEVAKMELLQSGKVTVKENNLDFTIDYGIDADSRKTYDWSDPAADILADIESMVQAKKDQGQTVTRAITSSKIVNQMRKNKGIQTAVFSALGVGTFLTTAKLNELMQTMFGLTIEINDERYGYIQADGKKTTKRYFAENKFVLLAPQANNTLGVGLWGRTPEEIAQGPFTAKSAKQYITLTMWATPDPVATWTKASGVFVPVLPNPQGLFIATITFDTPAAVSVTPDTSAAASDASKTSADKTAK